MAAKRFTKGTTAATVVVAFSLTLAPVYAEAVTVKQVRKIAREEATKVIERGVPPGAQGPQGPAGPIGPPGPSGPPGDGTAAPSGLRFAHVFPNGAIDPARTQGFTQDDVITIDTGGRAGDRIVDHEDRISDRPLEEGEQRIYCFILDPPAVGAQVTTEWGTGNGAVEEVNNRGSRVAVHEPVNPDARACQVSVLARIDNNGLGQPGAFFVLFY